MCQATNSETGLLKTHLEHQQEQEVSVSDPLELLKQVER